MKKIFTTFLLCLLAGIGLFAQVGINADNSTPDPSAMLDVKSTTSGMLVPRMTISERNAIVSPANGLMVFCTDNNHFYVNKGTKLSPDWVMMSTQWTNHGGDISYSSGKVGIGTSTPVSSASLEVTSTNTGVLIPRLTLDQRNAIAGPAEGLMVYCINCGSRGSLSIFSGGAWSTFSPCTSPVPVALPNVATPGQVVWNWEETPGASGYKWGTTTNYTNAIDMGPATTKVETGTLCDTTYLRYLWSYNSCSVSDRTTLTQVIQGAAPETPVADFHVSSRTSVVWNWMQDPAVTGFKWNMVDDVSTALDLGTSTTYTETGLSCATEYFRYVWSYNSCGYSVPVSLSQSTLACWVCGDSLQVIHVASGGVAPVDKTVTYGTLNNVPGEPLKCWITSNLGADHQATSQNDATEASAGWYWQFDHKQGFKHDGAFRTPGTAWLLFTNDNSNWLITNDPCAIELGIGWHIPTKTEWTNADATGGWTTLTDTWNSVLKLHAAGGLSGGDGALLNRGSIGNYWSSTQLNTLIGWYLNFSSGNSNMVSDNFSKFNGFSLRCLQE
jgi:hypothetical protein